MKIAYISAIVLACCQIAQGLPPPTPPQADAGSSDEYPQPVRPGGTEKVEGGDTPGNQIVSSKGSVDLSGDNFTSTVKEGLWFVKTLLAMVLTL